MFMVKPTEMPGADRTFENMPGHWVLARLGKRVLRPGGVEMTRRMLAALDIGPEDTLLEFAPGMGHTARRALRYRPAAYIGIDRDPAVVSRLGRLLGNGRQQFVRADADATGLPDSAVSVAYAEAILTMQPTRMKRRIIQEAARVLAPGGRIGFHEICLVPDDMGADQVMSIRRRLGGSIKHSALPETLAVWREMLDEAGLRVDIVEKAPMRLLEPARFVRDEGIVGTGRFVFNVLRQPAARRRVIEMRRGMRDCAPHMRALMIIASRPVAA